jgi:hypothetical protein
MKETIKKLEEILKILFKEKECGIYIRKGEEKYIILARNGEDMPLIIREGVEDYYYEKLNSNFVLLFKEDLKEFKNEINILKDYLENYFSKLYIDEIFKNLEFLKIPYVSIQTLGSIFKFILPDAKIFLWLKEKYNSFYFLIYSFPDFEKKFFSITFFPEEKILSLDKLRDYNLRKFLEDENINYVKILKNGENVLLWGFEKFPFYNKEIDELIEKFLPDKFLLINTFEIFIDRIYPKEYKNYREFALDIQKNFEEIEGKFPLYFKISFFFFKDEFYLDKDGFFKSLPYEDIFDLKKIKIPFGEIEYYIGIKEFHPFFEYVFEGKLKETSFRLFYENLYKSLETFDFEKDFKNFEFYDLFIPFFKNFEEFILINNPSLQNFEKIRKIFCSFNSIFPLILKEKELRNVFELIVKSIKEPCAEIEEIIFAIKSNEEIEKFFCSSKLIRKEEFEDVLKENESKIKWKKYFILKNILSVSSLSYELYFLFKKEDIDNNFYFDLMKNLNIFLYFIINFKEYYEKSKEFLSFEKVFPIKLKVAKNLFFLPSKLEQILKSKEQKINLKEIIELVIEKEKVKIIKKNINTKFLKKEEIFVDGYKELLEYAFSVIFEELIKHNRINGEMEIEINKEEKFIFISDTGIGLSKNQIASLCNPDAEKEDAFSLAGYIFKLHNFNLNIEVERGLWNKIKIFI